MATDIFSRTRFRKGRYMWSLAKRRVGEPSPSISFKNVDGIMKKVVTCLAMALMLMFAFDGIASADYLVTPEEGGMLAPPASSG